MESCWWCFAFCRGVASHANNLCALSTSVLLETTDKIYTCRTRPPIDNSQRHLFAVYCQHSVCTAQGMYVLAEYLNFCACNFCVLQIRSCYVTLSVRYVFFCYPPRATEQKVLAKPCGSSVLRVPTCMFCVCVCVSNTYGTAYNDVNIVVLFNNYYKKQITAQTNKFCFIIKQELALFHYILIITLVGHCTVRIANS